MKFPFILVAGYCLSLSNALTYRSADFSSLINLENSGIRYSDNGVQTPFENILSNHGANLARIRVWTSTNYSQYSTNYGLTLAKRAVAAGMEIMLDLHYSDTWADPGHQSIPSSWPKDLDGLNAKIYEYTKDIVTQFSNQGTPITILSIGNEISNGFLWPIGKASTAGFEGLSQLLHSAANGARDSSSGSSMKLMVHLANGWKYSDTDWFWSNIFRPGQFSTSDVDIMGFSFYPFYDNNAKFSSLQSTLQSVINTYGKDVFVVETDWPVSCSSTTMSEPSIPISASGQKNWVGQIKAVLNNLGGRGVGISYWEPGWIGNAGLGSSCGDNLLVDYSGNSRSSIRMFYDDM